MKSQKCSCLEGDDDSVLLASVSPCSFGIILAMYILLNQFSYFFLVLFSICHLDLFSSLFAPGFLHPFHNACISCLLISFLYLIFTSFFFQKNLKHGVLTWTINWSIIHLYLYLKMSVSAVIGEGELSQECCRLWQKVEVTNTREEQHLQRA